MKPSKKMISYMFEKTVAYIRDNHTSTNFSIPYSGFNFITEYETDWVKIYNLEKLTNQLSYKITFDNIIINKAEIVCDDTEKCICVIELFQEYCNNNLISK